MKNWEDKWNDFLNQKRRERLNEAWSPSTELRDAEMYKKEREGYDNFNPNELPDTVTPLIEFSWNTGRLYGKGGQPMAAMLYFDKVTEREYVTMVDFSRGISYTWLVGNQYLETEEDLADFVMQSYDKGSRDNVYPKASSAVRRYLEKIKPTSLDDKTTRYNSGWGDPVAYRKDWSTEE